MALLRRCSPLLLPLVLLAGCSNNNNSDREQQIRQDAEQQGRQEEKLKQLENEVKEQRKNGGTTTSSGGTTTPAPNNSTSSKSGNCGGGIFANSNTTCDFARNVATEYGKQSGPGVVSAFSPATGKTISMSCEGASPVVCTGGNGARVELR
jgi:hypothetical protein